MSPVTGRSYEQVTCGFYKALGTRNLETAGRFMDKKAPTMAARENEFEKQVCRPQVTC